MDKYLGQVPNSAEYVKAFNAFEIAGKLDECKLKILQLQYHSPGRTMHASDLARKIGYTGHGPVNRHYSIIGKFLSQQLNCQPLATSHPNYWAILSYNKSEITSEAKSDGHFDWTMRQEVAEALEVLGWAGDVKTESVQEKEFAEAVNRSLKLSIKSRRKKLAAHKPQLPSISTILQPRNYYSRNPHVLAETLSQANGTCDLCEADAPFLSATDAPYLEVHHIKHLADKGEDIVGNTAALCPNCHRKAHYGKERLSKEELKKLHTIAQKRQKIIEAEV